MITIKMDMLGIPRLSRLSAEEMGEVAQETALAVGVVLQQNFLRLSSATGSKSFWLEAAESVGVEPMAGAEGAQRGMAAVVVRQEGVRLHCLGGDVRATGQRSEVTGKPTRALLIPFEDSPLRKQRKTLAYTILRRSMKPQLATTGDDGEHEEVATNFNPNHGRNGQFTSGEKGGRESKDDRRGTQHVPQIAGENAKPQEKVNAIEHAMFSTRKGGMGRNVAKIGGRNLTIESGVAGKKRKGYEGGHGVVHQQERHGEGTKENTTIRTAAKALVHGEMTYDKEKGTYQHDNGRYAAYTAPKGNNTLNYITAHRKNKPKANGDKKEPQS